MLFQLKYNDKNQLVYDVYHDEKNHYLEDNPKSDPVLS